MTNENTQAPGRGVIGTDGIFRSFDEHYDTQREVEQDPYGAWLAIQSLTQIYSRTETKGLTCQRLTTRSTVVYGLTQKN